ncbi:MAG TPA: sulfite exporter TauE/SafE family protein [Candidatus Limnocylindrales bacterium]|nr:sulfite exporter TauE/SafE family protein [Candidatus Limnocylindrales bacterium]
MIVEGIDLGRELEPDLGIDPCPASPPPDPAGPPGDRPLPNRDPAGHLRSGPAARISALLAHPWLPLVATWLLLVFLAARGDSLVGLLIGLAFAGAFLSGLVGVGGAIVMIPLLLYAPPLIGLQTLGIKTVAGITIVQVTAAAFAGLLGHRQGIHRDLFMVLGPSMVVASFLGGLTSRFFEPVVLEAVFAAMATLAAAMMLLLRRRTAAEIDGPTAFSRPAAIGTGVGVGFAAGLLGAGGAFFLIPVMLYGLRIPVRSTVGTSLAVVAVSALAALLGKAVTGQIDWILAAALVVGALPGARLGSYVSGRTRTDRLVVVLGLVISLVALRMWVGIVSA